MSKTREDIVRDLLRDANYYWYDENEDNVEPLDPDSFDPVVDKIFKANALELEKLYAEIDESQREIIVRLSKVLVPDRTLLPEPGYTVAQIRPKAARVHTTPEDKFLISGQSDTGEKYEFYFTPLFEHNYPHCELAAILTDNLAIQVEDNVPEVAGEVPGGKSTTSVWLGLDIGNVEEGDIVPFYLGNRIVDEFDKDFYIFYQSSWLLQGEADKVLTTSRGLGGFTNGRPSHLLDAIDVPNSYEQQIYSRFRNSFLLLEIPSDIAQAKSLGPPVQDQQELISALSIKEPLCWIKVELPLAIPNDFLIHNILYPNCIPLVNRRLLENHVVKSGYDRILLPMPTTDLFLDVYKVQDTRNREDDTSYERIDFLHPDSQPGTYMLRGGSRVRRLNRQDASRQISRLLEVIHDEYSTFKEEGVNRLKEDFDVIEKAINRIKRQLPDFFREKEIRSSYFCIANFRPRTSRLYYQYWETQGDVIKYLGNKTGLAVTTSDIKISNSASVIPIQQGKGELTADDYISQLKISLLSKGKIITRGDIEWYIKGRYGRLLEVDKINRELMMVEEGKLGRGILVSVRPKTTLSAKESDLIRIELQNDLNAKSAFFTHIKVAIYNGS